MYRELFKLSETIKTCKIIKSVYIKWKIDIFCFTWTCYNDSLVQGRSITKLVLLFLSFKKLFGLLAKLYRFIE